MNLQTFFDRVVALREAEKAYAAGNLAERQTGLGSAVSVAQAQVDAAIVRLNVDRVRTVYTAFDTERAYQDRLSASGDHPSMLQEMSMGDILSAIDFNLGAANRAWYGDSAPYTATTPFLRKIGALATKAGEQFGMVSR